MERNNLGELVFDGGCEEVLKFLYENCTKPLDLKDYRKAVFEGEYVRIEAMELELGNICWGNENYPDCVFFIGEEEYDGLFPVFCMRNGASNDMALGVLLPSYVRDELIATAKGEW